MPDDPADACPPDAENNTSEAPAPRPAPLKGSDKADVGCLILMGFAFVGIFLLPAGFLLGGAPVIIPVITVLLLVLATPFLNPLERRSITAKWWGRVLTFLVGAGIVVAIWWWLSRSAGRMMEEDEFSRAAGDGFLSVMAAAGADDTGRGRFHHVDSRK